MSTINREVMEECSGKCRIIIKQIKVENQAKRYVRIGWMQCNQIVFRKRRNSMSEEQSDPGCHQAIVESENREQGQNVLSKLTGRRLLSELRHKTAMVVKKKKKGYLRGKQKKKKDHWV